MWERLWQLFFPDQCHGCRRFGALLCDTCSAQLGRYAGDSPACGATKFTIAFVYGGVLRSAILAVKYARQRRLGVALGELLAREPWQSGNAVVVPLPGAPQRVAQRGYDQAVVLAHAVATARRLPVSRQLVRVRHTTAQAKLSRRERHQNVAGAFVWHGTPPPAEIILVDDICTTGATMAAAISAITHAGPCAVHVVVLARGVLDG
ncbi:MAG: ComF family protein [Chloroflexia bacterium]|nr:ComF family protein [Chloroflexia bacterium]